MRFHQYSPLFTSGLLSDPSPHPDASVPAQLGRPPLALEPTDPESSKSADSRTCSFLELADSVTSPVSPVDLSSSGTRTASVATGTTAIRKPGSVSMRRSVLRPAPLNVCSPAIDSFLRISLVSPPTGQSSLITEPPLPDSPTLTRRPSRGSIARSTSSASLSVKSETKRMNRLAALACLEGWEPSTGTPRNFRSNFMSMSDDEDEDEPLTSSRHPSTDREERLSTITASNTPMLAIISNGEKGVESIPPDFLIVQPQRQSKMAPVRNRHRSRTMESWFPPLIDFIDLRHEEDPPSWGSFIEFSTATV